MIRHEQIDDPTASFIRTRLQTAGLAIPVPDIWSEVSTRLGAQPRRRIWRPERSLRPRWLAPAGAVSLALLAIIAWVMLLNNGDRDSVAVQPDVDVSATALAQSRDQGTPVDVQVIKSAIASLATAGPFRVESELFTTARPGGRIETLPGALDIKNATADGKTLRELVDSVSSPEEEFAIYNSMVPQFCVEQGPDQICLLALREDGPALATNLITGGTSHFESVFISPELYRVERTTEVSADFLADVLARAPAAWANLEHIDEVVTIRQQNGRFFDSTTRGPVYYGLINEGSADEFLALHLGGEMQFTGGQDATVTGVGDLLTLSNARQVSDDSADGTVHYRADVSGQIGESGIWDMWVNADGLPVRIEVEAYNSPRGTVFRQELGDLEVTRISIDFVDYGVKDPDDPIFRLPSIVPSP